MSSTTENTRKLPGDLEFLTPRCLICDEYTDAVDGGFDCCECGVTWDERGENPQRIDPDAVQCPSLYTPTVGPAVEYRCWMDAGHAGDHHHPDAFCAWTTAEQSGEAES